MGLVRGVITCGAQDASRRAYGYRVMLEKDQRTLNVKDPLEEYSADRCERNSGGLGAARARRGCTVWWFSNEPVGEGIGPQCPQYPA